MQSMNTFLNTGMEVSSILFVLSFTAIIRAHHDYHVEGTYTFQATIDYINSKNTTWKAGNNFEGFSMEQITGLMGVDGDDHDHRYPYKTHQIPNDLPDTFDAREQWPKCKTIGKIRDQGFCGSCWTVAVAEIASDGICIHSNAKVNVEISSEDVLSCCGKKCGQGCKSVSIGPAFDYWVKSGIVTGGEFNSHVGCRPYTIPPCEHYPEGESPYFEYNSTTPKCVHECEGGYDVSYNEDKHFGKEIYRINQDAEHIQAEIFKNGPVVATFHTYLDFIHYKSGVYQKDNDKKIGLHAVKLIGWGTERGVDYWLATNSWNDNWGDNGYFKIRRGTNECNLEEDIFAGLPKK